MEKTAVMALLHPTEGLSDDDRALCEQLWAKTTELLKPKLGKLYKRFEPASKAWGNAINKPFGVVLGRSDPQAFLLFYVNAKQAQEKAVKYHMGGVLGSLNFGEEFTEGDLHGVAATPKEGGEEDLSAHLFWHVGMMSGELFPDAGIYYVPARQAVISEALDRQILSSIGNYALSVVRLYAGDDDA